MARVRLQQHSGFVRRRRALERDSADQNDEMSLTQLGARPLERARAIERIEIMPSLGEARDSFPSELGAERNHHVIRGDVLPGYVRAPGLRVDPVDLADDELDASFGEARNRTRNLLHSARPDHEPEQRGRKDVLCLSFQQNDAVCLRQMSAQQASRHDASDAATQDEYGLSCCHDALHRSATVLYRVSEHRSLVGLCGSHRKLVH